MTESGALVMGDANSRKSRRVPTAGTLRYPLSLCIPVRGHFREFPIDTGVAREALTTY
jgi:hypothetical protein